MLELYWLKALLAIGEVIGVEAVFVADAERRRRQLDIRNSNKPTKRYSDETLADLGSWAYNSIASTCEARSLFQSLKPPCPFLVRGQLDATRVSLGRHRETRNCAFPFAQLDTARAKCSR